MPKSCPLSSTDVIATVAALIALLALGATLWQGAIARRHGRLSVRPLLDYHDVRESRINYGLVVANHGLGPAILTASSIRLDGREFTEFGAEYREFVTDRLHGYGLDGVFQALTAGTPLPAGSELALFKLSVPPSDDARLFAATRFLDEIELTIHYESIFGEAFILKRKPGAA